MKSSWPVPNIGSRTLQVFGLYCTKPSAVTDLSLAQYNKQLAKQLNKIPTAPREFFTVKILYAEYAAAWNLI